MRADIFMMGAAALLFSACGPKYPKCETDSQCHEGEYCVNSQCQQCRDDGDCTDGRKCSGGACRDIASCTTSSDCASGRTCRDGRCAACLTNADCASGQVCSDGACIVSECASDTDCPAGLSCTGHRCQPNAAAASSTSSGGCGFETVYFDFDSVDVGPDGRRALEHNAQCLAQRGGKVTIEGHCDPRGTTEYNMALGERRAQITKKLMRTLGTEGSAMRSISRGEEDARGTDEGSWAQDRRAEFR
jgi:peptidoglycan-associated lipoprotein